MSNVEQRLSRTVRISARYFLLCDHAPNDSFEDTGDDSDELSFKRGDILDIIDKSTTCWRARKADGTSGGECDRPIYSSFTACSISLMAVIQLFRHFF
jgi:hypothetical protein